MIHAGMISTPVLRDLGGLIQTVVDDELGLTVDALLVHGPDCVVEVRLLEGGVHTKDMEFDVAVYSLMNTQDSWSYGLMFLAMDDETEELMKDEHRHTHTGESQAGFLIDMTHFEQGQPLRITSMAPLCE